MTSIKVLVCGIVVGVLSGVATYGCGSSNTTFGVDDGGAGGDDGSAANGGDGGSAIGNDGGWNGGGEGGTCNKLGQVCVSASDCCSGTCSAGACQPPSCTSDGVACSSNGQCCGGTCTSGTCAALNGQCKTLGNACKAGSECCSKLCESGTCKASSFCGQNGDICTQANDCCGAICTKAGGGTFGTCAQPPSGGAQCQMIDGTVCTDAPITSDGGVVLDDAGLPACGGSCCSRLCAPWGPTGVPVCQPASGCRPVGEPCRGDTDCCGGPGVPGPPPPSGKPVTCNIVAPNTVGVCENPKGCKPNGDICRFKTNSCNATDECCSGNVQQNDTCKPDIVGVPRCTGAVCVPAGTGCATSADCCNGTPCVPNPGGTPPFVCAATQCIPTAGACTINADCCAGNICTIPPGGTKGTCTPNRPPPPPGGDSGTGGTPDAGGGSGCALYGQTCTVAADCCNGIPCNGGRCYVPVN